MGDEYAAVKRGKLILKGDKPKAKKRKHEKRDTGDESHIDEDCVKHGGWWQVKKLEEISGSVCIEFGRSTYVSALDNGLFTIGAPHDEGDGPSPEEIFTAFPAGENKFALKSGYGKYLGVSKNGVVTGRSDAVGLMEQWEPVFQDGEMAILSSMNKFISVNPEDDSVVTEAACAGERERCRVRSGRSREPRPAAPGDRLRDDHCADLHELELSYVKKFQKFQDKKVRVNSGEASQLEDAKLHGRLHEALLDRRSVVKADRYCK